MAFQRSLVHLLIEPGETRKDTEEWVVELFDFNSLQMGFVSFDDEQISHHAQVWCSCDANNFFTRDSMHLAATLRRSRSDPTKGSPLLAKATWSFSQCELAKLVAGYDAGWTLLAEIATLHKDAWSSILLVHKLALAVSRIQAICCLILSCRRHQWAERCDVPYWYHLMIWSSDVRQLVRMTIWKHWVLQAVTVVLHLMHGLWSRISVMLCLHVWKTTSVW